MAGKIVGAAEAKTNLLRLLDEVERTREPVTITKRGRVVGELHPPATQQTKSSFGCMKGSIKILRDIEGPVDPDWEAEWDSNNPPELYR